MFCKREVLFCAVALTTVLVVQAKSLEPLNVLEREEICDKTLAQACPGVADVLPFAYPPEPKKVDETCSAASTYFECFKKIASTCRFDPNDVESRYFLTYADICDTSSHLYEGVRESVKCMKIAEKKYNETCAKPMDDLEAELTTFASKISDHAISTDDWKKLETGLTTVQEVACFLQRTEECSEADDRVEVDTVKELFVRFGAAEKIQFLVENQAMVNKVLDNIKLNEDQKKMLRGKKN